MFSNKEWFVIFTVLRADVVRRQIKSENSSILFILILGNEMRMLRSTSVCQIVFAALMNGSKAKKEICF